MAEIPESEELETFVCSSVNSLLWNCRRGPRSARGISALYCIEEMEIAGCEVRPDDLDDEDVELTTDEPTTAVAVDFSETICGRSL